MPPTPDPPNYGPSHPTPKGSPAPSASPTSPAHGFVLPTDVLHCGRCGYHLHGLSRDADCPECGTPIEQSLRDELAYSSPLWLQRLRTALLMALGVRLAFYTMGVDREWLERRDEVHLIPWWLAFCTVSMLGLLAVWLITAPEPGGRLHDRAGARRRAWLRASASIESLGRVLVVLLVQWEPAVSPQLLAQAYWFLGGFLFGLASLVSTWLFHEHLRSLALRMPRPGLATFTRVSMALQLVSGFAYQAFYLLVSVEITWRGSMAYDFIEVTHGCGKTIWVVTGPIGWVMIALYLASLHRAARDAAKASPDSEGAGRKPRDDRGASSDEVATEHAAPGYDASTSPSSATHPSADNPRPPTAGMQDV